jgi:hypothetical protein
LLLFRVEKYIDQGCEKREGDLWGPKVASAMEVRKVKHEKLKKTKRRAGVVGEMVQKTP